MEGLLRRVTTPLFRFLCRAELLPLSIVQPLLIPRKFAAYTAREPTAYQSASLIVKRCDCLRVPSTLTQ